MNHRGAAEKGPSLSQPPPAAAAAHQPPWPPCPAHLTCLFSTHALPLPSPPPRPYSVPSRHRWLAQPACTWWGLGVVHRRRSPRPPPPLPTTHPGLPTPPATSGIWPPTPTTLQSNQ